MNPLDWDSISQLAAIAPLWLGLFAIIFWVRNVLGSRDDRIRARSAALSQWRAQHELMMLEHEATEILRQIESKRPPRALTAAKKTGAIDVYSSRIRFPVGEKPVLELDTPNVKIDLDEERIHTLVEDGSFVKALVENPQAFRLLSENTETLALLRQLMRRADEQAS